jgi:hypothetical protein
MSDNSYKYYVELGASVNSTKVRENENKVIPRPISPSLQIMF